MKYVITGGAGRISKPLTLKLLQAGQEVTVISRDITHLKELEKEGALVDIGSLEDIDFLLKAFKGADAAYTMYPPNYTIKDLKGFYVHLASNYVKAIEANGIKHVVNLSSIGAHLTAGNGPVAGLHRAEELLNTLDNVNIVHLRPAYFYANLFENIGMIKYMDLIGNNFSQTNKRFPMTDTSDIAHIAAELLINLSFTGHKFRYLASTETDTDEIAKVIGRSIGKPELKWVKFNDEQAMQGLLQAGLPREIAGELVELGGAIQSGKMIEDYWEHHPLQLGNVKLEDFAKTFAQRYYESSN